MTVVESYKPGVFCWLECATTDQAAGKEFYTTLFPWAVDDQDMGDGSSYTMFKKNGQNVAALYTMRNEMREQGAPPYWQLYVAVADADETAAKAQAAGGSVMGEAFDVFDSGRMALISDPGGGVLGVWQAKEHIGASVVNEHGALIWTELLAHDTKAAGDFYGQTFGWTTESMDMAGATYTVFSNDGRSQAGMMQIQKDRAPVPQSWMPYFAVDDCDAITEKAKDLGGSVVDGPMDTPGVGRFATLHDPQGAIFSVIKSEGDPPPP